MSALVLTTVSVVVILGAIIATIARAVLMGDGQPATTGRPTDRGGPTDAAAPPAGDETTGHHPRRAAANPGDEVELVAAADVRVDDRAAVPVVLDPSTPWWRRIQSIVMLALLVTALGVLAAGLLAVLVVGGMSLLNSALG